MPSKKYSVAHSSIDTQKKLSLTFFRPHFPLSPSPTPHRNFLGIDLVIEMLLSPLPALLEKYDTHAVFQYQ